jgi:hypothetical protein
MTLFAWVGVLAMVIMGGGLVPPYQTDEIVMAVGLPILFIGWWFATGRIIKHVWSSPLVREDHRAS